MFTFNIATAENGQRFLTVFAAGRLTAPIDDTHPNFESLLEICYDSMSGVQPNEQEVMDLFDIAGTIERKFARLSERVTVENGEVRFDGDPAQHGLSNQILRFMDEQADFEPLVKFLERIMTNPNEHSRNQAWDWLNNHDFSLTPDGNVVAYKGVYSDGAGGYRSGSRGNAFVNDTEIKQGYVPNAVGDLISMRRAEVAHDPAQACHAGLHVGTFRYAQNYAQGAMLKVIVDPRDIVSVPTDAAGEKIRVCRYLVDSIIDAPVTTAYDKSWDEWTDDDGEVDEGELEFEYYHGEL